MTNKCLKYFLNLLKVRDYSEKILVEKALSKNYSPEEIQESINYLLEKNFLNDLRLAENLVQKYKNQKGLNWIKQKLVQKGISKENIEFALKNLKQADLKPSNDLKKKIENKYKLSFSDWQNVDQNTRLKVNRFLQSRGYLNSFEIINNWIKNSDYE